MKMMIGFHNFPDFKISYSYSMDNAYIQSFTVESKIKCRCDDTHYDLISNEYYYVEQLSYDV